MENVENQAVVSKSDALKNKLRERYPEDTFESDDDFSSRISDDYDNYDKELAGYKEREGKITDLFNKDPMSAKFLHDWAGGEDPRVSLIRSYGKEGILAAFDDPDKQEEMAKANQEFIDNTANEKALEEEYQKNLANSFDAIEKFAQEKGISDDKIDAATDYLLQLSKDVIMGKFTPEAITSALHAMNYDKDVQEASYEGEVRGKNTAIDAKLRKPKGDGMPKMAGGNNIQNRPVAGVPGALGRDKSDIYAKGGFKRIPRKG